MTFPQGCRCAPTGLKLANAFGVLFPIQIAELLKD
jgi:hypothetical protein